MEKKKEFTKEWNELTDEEKREVFNKMRAALLGTTPKERVKRISKAFYVPTGFLGGHVIAICISWSLNHSILWSFVHGILGWIYVFYYALVR